MTVEIGFTRPWRIVTPPLFRYIETEYVEAFFETGELQLSSFAQFARHEDEKRLDVFEGAGTVYNINREAEGQMFRAGLQLGTHSYVLSTVMRHSPELMEEFADGSDFSYIRINNSMGFAFEVAKQLAGFNRGAEGPCIYQDSRVVVSDIGRIDPGAARSVDGITAFAKQAAGDAPLFMKHSDFAEQAEYRFIWQVSEECTGTKIIDVPDAVTHCAKASWIDRPRNRTTKRGFGLPPIPGTGEDA